MFEWINMRIDQLVVFQIIIITQSCFSFRCIFEAIIIYSFPGQSLPLSTTILNDACLQLTEIASIY